MLELENLLGKGYFPRELPPPFTSKKFAQKYSSINQQWTSLPKSERKKYPNSQCLSFSIPKRGFLRRQMSVPNPLHQSKLSQSICDYWGQINEFYERSPLTMSKPIIDSDTNRAIKTKKTHKEFIAQSFLDSYSRLSLMRADISRYYQTIYTHIIPWVLHDKDNAKSNKTRYNSDFFGNILDRDVRNTQSGQTMGIPIGPDTSLIISEIIACKIDGLNGARYYDDYRLFFSDYASADLALKSLQSILSYYHLELNEQKTKIENFSTPLENTWSIFLSNFEFKQDVQAQENNLYHYFTLAFEDAQQNPKDFVLKYAIARFDPANDFERVKILPDNWGIFESLLLKSALSEPSTLPTIVRIFNHYKSDFDADVNQEKVKELAQEIIRIHSLKVNSFEISWSLWLLRSLDISIDASIAQDVISCGDPISILVLLDMRDCGLISSDLDTEPLNVDITSSSLLEEKWLLAYESVKKGWLEPAESELLSSNAYFDLLSQNDVEFYDESEQEETTPSDGGYSVSIRIGNEIPDLELIPTDG